MASPLFASVNLEVDIPWDYNQIEADSKLLEHSKSTMHFNWENPKHKYFLIINALDVASTVYAMENRYTLVEGNLLLPSKPRVEELLVQKVVVTCVMNKFGLFSTRSEDQGFIDTLNIITTMAVLNNLHHINKYD